MKADRVWEYAKPGPRGYCRASCTWTSADELPIPIGLKAKLELPPNIQGLNLGCLAARGGSCPGLDVHQPHTPTFLPWQPLIFLIRLH